MKASFLTFLLAVGMLGVNGARAETLVFQQGAALPGSAEYAGAQDTQLEGANPMVAYGTRVAVRTDLDHIGFEAQGLLRFGNLFGALPDRIPPGSTISSAVLTLEVFNRSSDPVSTISVYQE